MGEEIYKACCTHPLCPGRKDVEHCRVHPLSDECFHVECGMLEEPSFCEMVKTSTRFLLDKE